MKIRRKSRELTLQALYYMDIRNNISLESLELYQKCFQIPKESRSFFLKLVKGVMQNLSQLDNIIEKFSNNWKIGRMSCVDRNIMRTAAFEMVFYEDIPIKVSINEAIDIGKKFGTEESGAFINGILDSIRIALEKKEIAPDFESRTAIPDRIDNDFINSQVTDNGSEPVKFSQVKGRPGVVKRCVKNLQDNSEIT